MSTAQSEGGLLLVPSSLKGDYDGESGRDERDRIGSLASDSERVDCSTRISSCTTLDMMGTSESARTFQNGPAENCFMNIANDPYNLRNADSGTVVGVCGGNASLVTTNCQASSATSFITVMSRPSHLSSNTSEARICVTGTAPVKVTDPPPIGTWLVPTGYNDGYAKPGPASHPQAFAVVDSYGSGESVIARLVERHPAGKNFTNLPLSSNARYVYLLNTLRKLYCILTNLSYPHQQVRRIARLW